MLRERAPNMQLLIQEKWVRGEAEDQGVKVTEDEVKKAFEEQKKQSFPKKGDYEIISLGVDGEPGGEGKNADIMNWNLDKD